MKIAVVTDDGVTISAHFGRAKSYLVCIVEDGNVTKREMIDKAAFHQNRNQDDHKEHRHQTDREERGLGKHSQEKHQKMFAPIKDCDVLLARGMGMGASRGLQQTGIRPVLTDIKEIEAAIQAVIEGTIVDHPERLH